MVFEATGASEAFLLARVLFGVVLAFTGINHLTNAEDMVGYSQAKGIPAAGLLVPATGFQLLAGGIGITLGAFPVVAAGAVAVFLLVATPTMHDFWAVPEEQQQSEMTSFLKNTALLGGALAFLALGGVEWPYAVGVGLF
ncbi:MAG: DoxX family protein [Halapricum sp.]